MTVRRRLALVLRRLAGRLDPIPPQTFTRPLSGGYATTTTVAPNTVYIDYRLWN